MRDEFISVKDLSDSKEMLLMRPNKLLAAFTVIIALLLAAAGVWMSVGRIDVYVTAVGFVRGGEAPSQLIVIDGGRALDVNMADGQTVSKGDVLLTFDQRLLNVQLENNNSDIAVAERDIALLKKYRDSVDDLTNYFDGDQTDDGRAYSVKVQSFLLERENLLAQDTADQAGARLKLSEAQDALAGLQTKQKWLRLYRDSIENGADMLSGADGDDAYKDSCIARFRNYLAGLDSLKQQKSQAQTGLDNQTRLYEAGAAPRKDMDDAQSALNDANNKLSSYRQLELSDANSNLADMDTQVTAAQTSVKAAQQDLDLQAKTPKAMQAEQNRLDLIAQIDDEIQQKTVGLAALNADNETIDARIADSEIVAPIDGVLNLSGVINNGDTIAPDTVIGTITPANPGSFKVTLQVSNKDIAEVAVNQPVKFSFLALPYQEYGMVDGYISQISADSHTDPQTGASAYTVEAVMENKPIKSYRGEDQTVRIGMAVEARLISGQKTIMRWLAEKMKFA